MYTLYACNNQLNSCLHHSPLIIRGVCHLFNEGRGCREADDFMRGKKSVGSLLPEHKFYHILKRGHRKREWGFEPPIDELLGSGAPNLGAGVRPLSVEWGGENGDGLELSATRLKEFRTHSAGTSDAKLPRKRRWTSQTGRLPSTVFMPAVLIKWG